VVGLTPPEIKKEQRLPECVHSDPLAFFDYPGSDGSWYQVVANDHASVPGYLSAANYGRKDEIILPHK